ncbi:hypothetical protein [Candidatus Poriferisodalis sp.]|uniref:hypothetical protein n=1 Tax=Candidatus Poriferisodalis sp. TaxID=3101277 RepID=UPI003B01D7FC
MNRAPVARGDGEAGAVVAAICHTSDSAWRAVSALLDYARPETHGEGAGNSGASLHEQAVAVSAALEQRLIPRGVTSSADTAYRPAEVAQVIAGIPESEILLPDDGFALATATALDQFYWPSFTRDWLAERGMSFELSAGDLYPIGEMRLMGAVRHSALPHRLALPPGELAHVRRRAEDRTRVRVIGEYAPIIDRLAAAPPLEAAVVLPNEALAEINLPPNEMGPVDLQTQQSTIDRLLREAREQGVDVVVLPELSVDEDIVEWLSEQWANATDLPILFAGSAHMVEDGRRVNRTAVLLPGVGTAWHHDKFTVFEGRDGVREPIDPAEPCITIGCGHLVRVASLVCKDALSVDHAGLVADLGVHLLAVPAMSSTLGEFSTAAHLLISRSQGATVVANNPRMWDGSSVGHALLGQPVRETDGRCLERQSRAAPDLGIARLGTGWR